MKRVLIAVLGLATSASAVTPSRTVQPNLYFEPNQGQSGGEVQFLSRGMGGTAYLTGQEMTFRLGRSVVHMRLEGGSPSSGEALAPQAGVSSYFAGKDRAQWRSGVRHYGQVRFGGVYRGIDMVYYGSGSKLEYDFVVAPGADPRQIQLAYSGLQSMEISESGDLVLRTSSGDIRQHRPPAITLDPSTIEIMTSAAGGTVTRQIGVACDQCTVESVALDGGTWLSGDSAAGELSIAVDPAKLSPGTYTGVVRLIPPDGAQSGDVIVRLRVVAN
jgi:hypothetical protein